MKLKYQLLFLCAALLFVCCDSPFSPKNSVPVPDNTNNTQELGTAQLQCVGGETFFQAAANQNCDMTVITLSEQTNTIAVTCAVRGLTTGMYKDTNVAFGYGFLYGHPLYETKPNMYVNGPHFYDVMTGTEPPVPPFTEPVEIWEVDSSVAEVIISISISGDRVSGTISGQLGAQDPNNEGLPKRINPPIMVGISGTFNCPLWSKLDCNGNQIQ